jgi:hypothetical protein
VPIRGQSGNGSIARADSGYESDMATHPQRRPAWSPLPVYGDSPLTAVPAVISLLVWPTLRLLVELPVYLVRRLL